MAKKYILRRKKRSKREALRAHGLDFYTFVLPVADMAVFFSDSKELGYARPNDYMTAIIKGETAEENGQ
jgi:hypothetical protein